METSPASSQPQKGYAAIVRTLLAMLVLCGAAPMFADSVYRSVFVDGSGQLHFVLESGKEVLPQKTHGQDRRSAFVRPNPIWPGLVAGPSGETAAVGARVQLSNGDPATSSLGNRRNPDVARNTHPCRVAS